MIKNNRTLFLGIFLLLILFLGFPSSWKTFFVVISGLYLIVSSLKISLPKKGVAKKIRKKEKATPVFVENSPITKMEDIIIQKDQTLE